MPVDYVASFKAEHGTELLHHGVKGQKWGVRRSSHGNLATRVIGATAAGYSRQRRAIIEVPKGTTKPKIGQVIEHPGSHTGKIKIQSIFKVPKTESNYRVNGGDTKYPLTHKVKIVRDTTTKVQHVFNHKVVHRGVVISRTVHLASMPLRVLAMSDEEKPNDYIGAYKAANGDEILHHGIKGMKWGIRRSNPSAGRTTASKPTRARVKEKEADAKAKQHAALTARIEKLKIGGRPLIVNGKQLSRAESVKHLEKQAKKVAPKTEKTVKLDIPKKKPVDAVTDEGKPTKIHDFNALKVQVRKKGANSLTDDELKYLNSRTEAINKARASYAKKDGWLAKNVKSSVDKALSQQLQRVVGAATAKYLGDVLVGKVNNPGSTKTAPSKAGKTKFKWKPSSSFRSTPLKALPAGSNPPVFKITTLGD